MTRKIGSHSGILGRGRWATRGALALAVVFLWAAVGARAQGTPSYSVLHTFTGADGEYPQAGLVRDWEGNLYSTAFLGGDLNQCGGSGCGVVFKLDRHNKETVLYTFEGGTDGAGPAMDLLRDQAGNLYSTTHTGGDVSGCTGPGFPSAGCGVVFKVDPRRQGDRPPRLHRRRGRLRRLLRIGPGLGGEPLRHRHRRWRSNGSLSRATRSRLRSAVQSGPTNRQGDRPPHFRGSGRVWRVWGPAYGPGGQYLWHGIGRRRHQRILW